MMNAKRMRNMMCTALAGAMLLLTGCSGSANANTAETAGSTAGQAAESKVLRVGMECAYAPFNWTQFTEDVPDGSKAVPIYGSSNYAYGYDVMVAQKLADQMGMTLEIHKVEWDSIGLSLDAKEYDCIIAGMGRTREREASYSFTEPYYYRDNCLVVKAGSEFENIKGLSDLAVIDLPTAESAKLTNTDLVIITPDTEPCRYGILRHCREMRRLHPCGAA